MKVQKVLSGMVVVLLAALIVVSWSSSARAQTNNQQTDTRDDETNLDTQLFLLVATNQPISDEKLPASLDGVVKQLRATLPFKNYRLAATLINRVKNEGRLDLSWIGGPLASVSPTGAASNVTPSFSQFKVRQVKLVRNAENQQIVQM